MSGPPGILVASWPNYGIVSIAVDRGAATSLSRAAGGASVMPQVRARTAQLRRGFGVRPGERRLLLLRARSRRMPVPQADEASASEDRTSIWPISRLARRTSIR
jgi:hypothetical protein